MSIFKRKEKKEDKDLPKLPKLEFPNYEPQINRMEKPEERREVVIPKRESIMQRERHSEEMSYEPSIPRRKIDIVGEKPLFIKIDKYKEAINDLENIKKRVREAESILGELERIKAEEDREIENWKIELERIKSKLLDVDKKLFEEI